MAFKRPSIFPPRTSAGRSAKAGSSVSRFTVVRCSALSRKRQISQNSRASGSLKSLLDHSLRLTGLRASRLTTCVRGRSSGKRCGIRFGEQEGRGILHCVEGSPVQTPCTEPGVPPEFGCPGSFHRGSKLLPEIDRTAVEHEAEQNGQAGLTVLVICSLENAGKDSLEGIHEALFECGVGCSNSQNSPGVQGRGAANPGPPRRSPHRAGTPGLGVSLSLFDRLENQQGRNGRLQLCPSLFLYQGKLHPV